MSLEGHAETQLFTNFLLQVSIQELHISMVIPQEEGGIKEARYAYNNIIISEYTIHNTITNKRKKMSARYRIMCCCEYIIYAKSIHSYLLTCQDHHLIQIKDRSCNLQRRRSSEKTSRIFETYKNDVKPHGCHIHNKGSDMVM